MARGDRTAGLPDPRGEALRQRDRPLFRRTDQSARLIETVVRHAWTDASACGDVAVSTVVTSAIVTRWRSPTKEGLGVDRPSNGRREPKSAIVTASASDVCCHAVDQRERPIEMSGIRRKASLSSLQ